jgi:hypothetical protein
MGKSVEERIAALLDQLESPTLSELEISTIERKLRILKDQQG